MRLIGYNSSVCIVLAPEVYEKSRSFSKQRRAIVTLVPTCQRRRNFYIGVVLEINRKPWYQTPIQTPTKIQDTYFYLGTAGVPLRADKR
jgi:hypothetical protein